MAERFEGNVPEPEEVVADVEQFLGLSPDASPESNPHWREEVPLFPEEASTQEQRTEARAVVHGFMGMLERPASASQPELTDEYLQIMQRGFEARKEGFRLRWEHQHPTEPFPDIALPH